MRLTCKRFAPPRRGGRSAAHARRRDVEGSSGLGFLGFWVFRVFRVFGAFRVLGFRIGSLGSGFRVLGFFWVLGF